MTKKRCYHKVYSWSIMNERTFAASLGALLLRCPLFKPQDSNTAKGGQSSTQGPVGGSVALWPLGSRPWCRVPWGVTRRQSKWYSMQGEEGECGKAGKVTWEGERGHKVSWVIVQGERERGREWESHQEDEREEEEEDWDAAEWRVWPGSGWMGLTDSRECGEASRKQHNEEAALAQRPRPITQPLLFIHFVLLFFFQSPLCISHTLCPLLLLSLFSHFLSRCSKYPRAVNSNRSFNDTSRHWQVLSPRATIVRDARRDKIGATNSDIENEHNSEEAGRKASREAGASRGSSLPPSVGCLNLISPNRRWLLPALTATVR